jgi:tetratricopeptide (TPR) repeat protein
VRIPVSRRTLLIAFLAAYGVVFFQPFSGRRPDRLDPISARPRSVEQAIGDGRFADALAVALELRRDYPRDPLPLVWLAAIYRGLDRARDEVAVWEAYVSQVPAPSAACPALPDAYDRLRQTEQAIHAYERCVGYDPASPQRLIDLAVSWERRDDKAQALAAYRRAAQLDARDPLIRHRIQALERHDGQSW